MMINISKHVGELRPLQLCQEKKKDYFVCDYFPVREVELFKSAFFVQLLCIANGCRILKKHAVRQRCL